MLRRALLLATLGSLLAAAPAAAYQVTIRETSHGIPHIVANDYGSLGYGYGLAFAEDNVCTIADSYVTVRGERSRFFGPDRSWRFSGNGATVNNLNSDFFFQRIIDRRTVETMMDRPPPDGPRPEIREAIRGYVAGYNEYLRRTGVDKLADPTCRGQAWVRPIEEIDAYRRFYQLALLASSGVAIDGIGGAAPVVGGAGEAAARRAPDEDGFRALAEKLPLGGIGSNAYGLGREATDNGRGMVLGNPHFPWDGAERFYQAHLTIPGKLDVSGASLFGVPIVLIGHTKNLGWSHTVSTAFRFTPFEVKLVPGSPTTYVVDGQPREMTADRITVDALNPDGSVSPRTRTLYSTVYGPMFDSILGLPLFPWTPLVGYAMGDANAANFRYLNHFFETNHAQSVEELDGILRRNQGIPWVNTIAADSKGRAYYADISVVPHVTDEKSGRCVNSAIGLVAVSLLALPVLDGSQSACNWGRDADAVQEGTFGPRNLPHLFRYDYVHNGNDSFWLTNPEQPLEGFHRIIGNERTPRSLRTRLGLVMVEERLAGTDGRPGDRFSLRQLQDTVFNNRQYAGELFRDELVSFCRANPTVLSTRGPVSTAGACDALAGWNGRDDVDSRGAVLFRRFATRALAGVAPVATPLDPAIGPFQTPYTSTDPVHTPSNLNTGNPRVGAALGDAIRDLQGANIPLDAPLGDFHYEMRGEEKIPIHGGPGGLGVFNAISNGWNASKGYPDVIHGSSFVMAVQFTDGCPDARSILTYSQSANRESPYFADQTRMYSKKQWNDMRFCEREVLADPKLRMGARGDGLLREVNLGRASFGGRKRTPLTVRYRLARRANVTVTVLRGRKVVRTVRARGRAANRVQRLRVSSRGLARATYRIRVTARAAKGRDTASLAARRR